MEVEQKIIAHWCRNCRLDWKVISKRHWINTIFGEVWVARCGDCGRRMIRLINDARNDPYYRLSTKTRRDVRIYADDLIQPDDPRFDVLYPHIKREREEKAEKLAKENYGKTHQTSRQGTR